MNERSQILPLLCEAQANSSVLVRSRSHRCPVPFFLFLLLLLIFIFCRRLVSDSLVCARGKIFVVVAAACWVLYFVLLFVGRVARSEERAERTVSEPDPHRTSDKRTLRCMNQKQKWFSVRFEERCGDSPVATSTAKQASRQAGRRTRPVKPYAKYTDLFCF